MVDFLPCHAHRNKDGCVYNKARKTYTRKAPPKSGWHKFNPLPREKCAIIKLTGHGYTINQIATLLGRSTSYIHRTIRTAITRGILHPIDKRKLPNKTRLATSTKRRNILEKVWGAWESFIYAEVDKPP